MNEHERLSNSAEAFQAAASSHEQNYVLRLFVTGMTPRSTEAIAAIKAICEQHLTGRYDLEVIDIYQRPELATEAQIIAAPTLVKQLPEPLRRLIGNLSDQERVLIGLDLNPKDRSPEETS